MATAAAPSFRNESTAGGELIEAIVCQNSDLKENEMKVFEIGKEGDQVLLVKQQGKVYAVGNKCSHYGAPLVNGALGKGRVRCPWHGACFNLQTGDIEDFPGLDGIPHYDCEIIAGGGVRVKAYKSQLKENKRFRLNRMMTTTRDPKNSQTFVIIGAGAAGNNCAETLRHQGFMGRIVLISGEKYLPYDRIKLSKVLNVEPPSITLRSESFYKDADIDLILDTKAIKIKTDERLILLNNGSQLEYYKVFISTGSRGRTVKLHGSDLHNIFTLRNIDDGKNIHSLLSPDKNVVIIGASFIGMEVASYCVGKVKSVTVVSRTTLPFDRLGDAIGERIAELFKSKGVKFEMDNVVERYNSVDGITVSEVMLKNNDVKLPADIVIIGLGVEHNTEFLAGSEIIMKMDGSIPVDKFLETNVKGVYAGGDIAFAPVFVDNDRPATIGHWQLAHYHGYIAAFNMLGKARPLQSVPFFWTVLFGLSFRYAGVASSYDDVVITGSLKDLKFVAYYCDGDKVNAILTVGSDPLAAKFAELLYNNKRLRKADVTKTKIDWMESPTF